MTKTRDEYLAEFKHWLALVKKTHDLARERVDCRDYPCESHLINENTLVRVYEEVMFIAQRLGEKSKWFENGEAEEGYPAFVTLYLYRTSIVHNRGYLMGEYRVGRNSKPLSEFYPHYKAFCDGVDVEPLNACDKLKLPVTKPDFLSELLEDVERFAESMLGNQSRQRNLPSREKPTTALGRDTSIGTGMFGPPVKRNRG